MKLIYLSVIFSIFVFSPVFAQKNVGIIDTQRLLDELPSRKMMIAEIMEIEAKAVEELRLLDSLLVESKKEGNSDDVNNLKSRIETREKTVSEELMRLSEMCNTESMKIINDASTIVSDQRKLDFVVDKKKSGDYKKTIDVTEDVKLEMLRLDAANR